MPFDTTLVVRTASGPTYFASSAVAASLAELTGFWRLVGQWVLFLNRNKFLRAYHDRWYYAVARRRVALSNALVRIHLLDESCRVPKK
jgi:predicted DCC family thiol-disulfide oxidoreductase YuxK